MANTRKSKISKDEFDKQVDARIEVLKREGKLQVYPMRDSIPFNSRMNTCYLSNMYPCKLQYKCEDGVVREFWGVDHLYHYMLFKGHNEIQDEILKCCGVRASFEAKEICHKYEDKVKHYSEIDCWRMLSECMKIKALHFKEFRDMLLNSGDKYLVEYEWWSRELSAGCNRRGYEYVGENLCGRTMMKVREWLRARIAEQQKEASVEVVAVAS